MGEDSHIPDYTTIFNLLDYTAVTVPISFADKKIDIADESYKPISEVDEKNWEACKLYILAKVVAQGLIFICR